MLCFRVITDDALSALIITLLTSLAKITNGMRREEQDVDGFDLLNFRSLYKYIHETKERNILLSYMFLWEFLYYLRDYH